MYIFLYSIICIVFYIVQYIIQFYLRNNFFVLHDGHLK